ncbi:MAG: hypothetical protein ABSF54_16690 [Bryobacteraceae bacterium]|jgi:hypothetical protein
MIVFFLFFYGLMFFGTLFIIWKYLAAPRETGAHPRPSRQTGLARRPRRDAERQLMLVDPFANI